MAKWKQRYKKKKKQCRGPCVVKDKHHIFFMKKDYRRGALWELRSHEYCCVMLPKRTLHKCIHEHMNGVPAPSLSAAKDALFQLNALDKRGALNYNDPIEKRLKLLASLFDCAAQPTADALRKQLSIVRRYPREPP